MTDPFAPLAFRRGRPMKNRFMLAPLTNTQSGDDGVLSDAEINWLVQRATGGFGAVMTAAAHVQAVGRGFPGQLGVFDDRHIPGLTRLATEITETGALALVQLHHAGNRSPHELIEGPPVSSSDDPDSGARGLSLEEVHQLRDDFITAAKRCDQAGMDGIEIHGAHGYMITQFLSPKINRRDDEYGGSFENRMRLLDEIIEGIRTQCNDDFIIGVRFSPERFGMVFDEALQLASMLLNDDRIDFVDASLWDTFKEPVDEDYAGKSLGEHFGGLGRDRVALGFAGKLYRPADVQRALDLNTDFVLLGTAAIVQADFPNQMAEDPDFAGVSLPVTKAHLATQGVSAPFIEYLAKRDGFIAD